MQLAEHPQDSLAPSAGKLLAVPEAAARLGGIDVNVIYECLRAPEDDPLYLPSVRVPARGRLRFAYLIPLDGFEAWVARHSTPTPLPADSVITSRAIDYIAGERVSESEQPVLWRWFRSRLYEAIEFDVLTAHAIFGKPRWAIPELDRVKTALAGIRDGAPGRARESARTRGARHAREARRTLAAIDRRFVDLAETTKITAKKRRTVESWSGQGGGPVRFGCRKIGGELFFEREQVESYDRATPGKAIPCRCASCGAELERTPSRIARASNFYCPTCWEQIKPTGQVLRDGLRRMEENDPDELFRRRSEGQKPSWSPEGARDRGDYPVLGDATADPEAPQQPDDHRGENRTHEAH